MSKWAEESSLSKPSDMELLLVFYPGRHVKVNSHYDYHVVEVTLDSDVCCRNGQSHDFIFHPHFIEVSDDNGATWYAPFRAW
jgi:hypothetical protein